MRHSTFQPNHILRWDVSTCKYVPPSLAAIFWAALPVFVQWLSPSPWSRGRNSRGEWGECIFLFYLLNIITPLCLLKEVGQKVKKRLRKKVKPFFSTLNPTSLNLVLDLQTFPGNFYGKRQQICFSSVKIFPFFCPGPRPSWHSIKLL